MAKCDSCNQERETKKYTIKDEMGTRYRDLCDECASQVEGVAMLAGNEATVSKEIDKPKENKPSVLYKALSIIIAILGCIGGIVCGSVFPIQELEYEYPTIQSGKVTIVEKFNAPVMIYVWIGTAILFFGFWAAYCILKNQEKLLSEIETIKR